MKRVCPTCEGEGELKLNPGWPDPEAEIYVTCRRCGGTCEIEVREEALRAA